MARSTLLIVLSAWGCLACPASDEPGSVRTGDRTLSPLAATSMSSSAMSSSAGRPAKAPHHVSPSPASPTSVSRAEAMEAALPRSATCAFPSPPSAAAVVRRQGLEYRRVGSRALHLDFAAPPRGEQLPLVLLVHGGGWRAGERAHLSTEIEHLVGAGFAAASVDYRLVPDHSYPAPVSDVRCAIRFLRTQADRLRIDPTRIAAVGFSAGGHLVSLAAVADDPALDDAPCEHRASPVPDAWVAYFAPFDLTNMESWPHPAARALVERFLGARLQDAPARVLSASPLHRVRTPVPPAFLVHGTRDRVVPVSQSHRMRDRLRNAGSWVDMIEIPGVGHGFRLFGGEPQTRAASCGVLSFLDRFRRGSLLGSESP